MENVEPLTERELDELDAFLLSDAVPEHCMDLSMLDGFVTALAAGPVPPVPERWLPEVWGGGEIRWSSRAQEERITALILRHAAVVYWYLRDEPEFFDPLLFESDEEAGAASGEGAHAEKREGVPLLDDWCSGFVEGIVLDEAAWQPLMDDAENRTLLQPILRYGSEDGAAALEAEPPTAERRIADAAALGEAVLAVNAYWLPRRKAASTLRRDGSKIGRNDPCPCGSGRKYKKCCGVEAA